jgi:starvation-inducible DNA-binding protein
MESISGRTEQITAQPRLHQRAAEIQPYGTVTPMLPLDLEQPVRLEMTEQLNQILADTMTLRDLYKKSHWQVAGPTFYQLHLLFDKHYGEQANLVDVIAERIQLLGGVSIAMAADVAETTRIERPPRGREEVPVQISRLVDAHQTIVSLVRVVARRASQLGDVGSRQIATGSKHLRSTNIDFLIPKENKFMKPSTRDNVEGTIREVNGNVKEAAGKITANPKLVNAGKREKLLGKGQKIVASVEKSIGE